MIQFGQYRDGNSFIHRLDARVKIGATALLSIFILQAQGWQIALLSTLLCIVCIICRLKLSEIRQAFRPLVWFALLLFLLHLFFTSGSVLFQIPYLPLKITWEGLCRGLFISWQFVSLAMSGAILAMTTSPSDLVCGLEQILSPLKYVGVPVQDIAIMVSMALRFVPTLLNEYDRIKTAQIARGAQMEKVRFDKKLKSLVAMITPLMISAFRRADELSDAMEARGYSRGPRTTLHQPHFGRDETVALIVLGFLLSFVLISGYCL
jgi:energy-coupling factor transporter transmembrane protein EcfT